MSFNGLTRGVEFNAAATTTSSTDHVGDDRRKFIRGLGAAGVSATAALLFGDAVKLDAQTTDANLDTANQIFAAAMIAEDLATSFYYNGLIGAVIQDADLAGPGGTALLPTTTGQPVANVAYLRAAFGQEIAHANLLRAVANLGISAATDPYQMFYFPGGQFLRRLARDRLRHHQMLLHWINPFQEPVGKLHIYHRYFETRGNIMLCKRAAFYDSNSKGLEIVGSDDLEIGVRPLR